MSARRGRLSRGQWAVERERFQLNPDETPPVEDNNRPFPEVIQDALKSLGLHHDHDLARIREAWTTLAGPQVAAHARPGAIQGHMLVIYVDHPMWLTELQRGGDRTVLANLQREGIRTIKRVRFQIDPEMGR